MIGFSFDLVRDPEPALDDVFIPNIVGLFHERLGSLWQTILLLLAYKVADVLSF